jgi:hypothetical protein
MGVASGCVAIRMTRVCTLTGLIKFFILLKERKKTNKTNKCNQDELRLNVRENRPTSSSSSFSICNDPKKTKSSEKRMMKNAPIFEFHLIDFYYRE